MKKKRQIAVCVIFVFVTAVMISCLGLILVGTAISIPCFAVDSQGRVYVGSQDNIEVYNNGFLERTIKPKTSRGYMFTVLENDTILLSTSTVVYAMDLSGTVTDSWEDKGADTYNKIQYGKKRYLSSSGDVYELEQILGRTRIIKNGKDVVYSISLKAYIVKLLLIVSTVCFTLLVGFILYKKLPVIAKQKWK